jgi:hypothetical protein
MSGNGRHLGFTFFIGRMTEVLVPDIQGVSKKTNKKKRYGNSTGCRAS